MKAKAISRAPIYASLALVTLFWAGNSIAGRLLRDDIGPLTLAAMRWTIALLLLLPIAWKQVREDRAAIALHWRPVLVLGVLGVACYNTLLYLGLRDTTASNALLIQASVPLFVLMLEFLTIGAKPSPRTIAGAALGAVGVAIIVFRGDPRLLLTLKLSAGDGIVMASAFTWACYTVLLRTRPPIHPLSFLASTFAVGAIVLAPLAVWEQGQLPVKLNRDVLLGMSYIAVFPSLIAFLLYNKAVQAIGAPASGQMITLQPVFGALLATVVLNEVLSVFHVVGMIVISAGIALAIGGARAQSSL